MRLDPAEITYGGEPPGFKLDVLIEGVADLGGFSFQIAFDEERNKVVNIFDILALALRFGTTGASVLSEEDALDAALTPPTDETSYHPAYDRGPVIGGNNWERGPADASINVVDDILGVAGQFGHDCS